MNRRDILRAMALGGGVVAGELWIPGQRVFSIPTWSSPSVTGYYIDAHCGDDVRGDGSVRFPWRTLAHLQDAQLPEGDTFATLMPGRYDGDLIMPRPTTGTLAVRAGRRAEHLMVTTDAAARPGIFGKQCTIIQDDVVLFGDIGVREEIERARAYQPGQDHGDDMPHVFHDPRMMQGDQLVVCAPEPGWAFGLAGLRLNRGGH